MNFSDGWILMSADDGQEWVPVRPHPRNAAARSSADRGEAVPTAIPLDAWPERWTPGLLRDGRRMAVFPLPGGQGVVVAPEQPRDGLAAEGE